MIWSLSFIHTHVHIHTCLHYSKERGQNKENLRIIQRKIKPRMKLFQGKKSAYQQTLLWIQCWVFYRKFSFELPAGHKRGEKSFARLLASVDFFFIIIIHLPRSKAAFQDAESWEKILPEFLQKEELFHKYWFKLDFPFANVVRLICPMPVWRVLRPVQMQVVGSDSSPWNCPWLCSRLPSWFAISQDSLRLLSHFTDVISPSRDGCEPSERLLPGEVIPAFTVREAVCSLPFVCLSLPPRTAVHHLLYFPCLFSTRLSAPWKQGTHFFLSLLPL